MLSIELTDLDGRRYMSDQIERLEFSNRLDTPAQSILVTLLRPGWVGELVTLRAFYGGELFFEGQVDEQEYRLSTGQDELEIGARSAGAALLDNEAIPAAYNCPCLEDLYKLHLKPYGVRGCRGSAERCGAVFPVYAGMSEWDVVRGFCTGVLGVLPRLTEGMILDATGQPTGTTVVFDNLRPGAYRYTSLSVRCVRSGVIGEIVYRSERDGAYIYRARSKTAQRRAITARQVMNLSGAADWEKGSAVSRRFLASELGSEEIVVKSPQYVRCRPGDRVCVPVPGRETDGWTVYEINYYLFGGELGSRAVLRPEREIRGWSDNVADTAAVVTRQST